MTTTSTATATRTDRHYAITVDGQTVEFNDRRAFDFVVIGRSLTGENGWGGVKPVWTVWARTNRPRGAEQKYTIWGRRQVAGGEVEVLVVPVEHR